VSSRPLTSRRPEANEQPQQNGCYAVITKSPSECDGKPIGTPGDAVSAWKAGVTTGLDVIERDEAARKARNRAVKAAFGEQRKERAEAFQALTTRERRQERYPRRRRMARARQWAALVKKGRTIASIAAEAKRSSDEVFTEIKWWNSGGKNSE
jgi:hypothetical protein